jgi:hypothetical protein
MSLRGVALKRHDEAISSEANVLFLLGDCFVAL